ncbi:MAG: hypothetical protein V2J26_08575 [Pacificimonas sp.]|jgi:PII-like signaling protein|nr:hypothetical protein [Pacificimonas sp.]
MTDTIHRRRIQVLADKPLMRELIAKAAAVGIENYTLFQAAGGMGESGRWTDDQVTGATAKQMFLAICDKDHEAAFTDAVQPILDSHGLMLLISDVEVVRGKKY